VTLSVAVFELR